MLKGMKWFNRQLRYGERGFTLIELLVVVAILGVLAAVAIPSISKFTHTGDSTAANTELSEVQTAAVAYAIDTQPTANFDSTVLTPYLNKAATGTYHFLDTGQLDESTVPTYPNVTYSTTKHQFQ